ncbi:UDP-N-acetylmuramate dehydrogenase [Oceanicoccus sp. KOV_DT_Chl]|uniref:UDP-N-acetylmuramate dehydrogenase n=1 Tax=Oceanicoccus sp. KOV_DT_Chl TaxID=1904639 RepID=UPI000C79AFF0|nr:UDP-N-acetylmuramate dehydrogenase [Oceanicoccus sp. KOV_DT_Chl]
MKALQQQVSLQPYNTLAIAVNARYFVELDKAEALPEYLAFAEQQQLPVLVLGGGSNIVLRQDFPGLVIKISLHGIAAEALDDSIIVTAAAGENWHDLVMWCLERGYNGLENLALIPGSVGAAPIQNIGAYGVEFTQVFAHLHGWDIQQQCWRTLSKAECQFAYRDSIFKHALKNQFIVTSVALRLHTEPRVTTSYAALRQYLQQQSLTAPTARQIAAAVIAIRQSKLPDPVVLPNAGSFFKNPIVSQQQAQQLVDQLPALVHYPQDDGSVKLAAGWLLEHAGWKGKQCGLVAMHQQQALVLINVGDGKTMASGAQVLAFAKQVQADIQQRFGVILEIEPAIIGDQPSMAMVSS